MDQILPHWLSKQATLAGNKVAFECEDGETFTFIELERDSKSFARRLSHIGVLKGSKVAILSHNHYEMVVAIFAISYLKAVAVMLNTRLSTAELTYQMEASNSMLLITTEVLRESKCLTHDNQKTFSEINTTPKGNVALTNEIVLNEPFTWMFTSGTTGKPKAVIHTYGNHWWSAVGSALNLGLHKEDKWLLTLPIFHVGGLSILMKSVIYGMEVFLMKKYDPQLFFKVLTTKNITIASVVTLMLENMIQSLGENELSSKIRCLLLGGGAAPKPLLDQVKKKQIPLFQSYGMTETSSQIVALQAEDTLRKIGSSGKPLFPAQLNIIDKNEEGIGEITVKGPMVFNGYDQNHEVNKTAFSDGWFKTGDLGYTDNEGFLYVVDRRTDLIISGGENIYPQEIENVLLNHEAIHEVAIVGKSDKVWGQIPVAFIVIKNQMDVTADQIKAYLMGKIAMYKMPKEFYFVDGLPRNASNKIMRHQLKNVMK